MDALLGNYGSDDDDKQCEEKSKLDSIVAPKVSNTNRQHASNGNTEKSSSSSSVHVTQKTVAQKKRKLLDISILPEHIQKALIHGDATLGDSDDDNSNLNSNKNIPKLNTGKSSTETSNKADRSKTIDPLLAMLPPPSQRKEDAHDALFASSSLNRKEANNKIAEKSFYQEVEEDLGMLGGSVGLDTYPSFASTAPVLTRQFTSEPDTKLYVPLSPSMTMGNPIGSLYNNLNEYYEHNSTDNVESANEHTASTGGESQRKRQRQMEQMLMAGNLSALEQNQDAVQDIHIDRQWDLLGYTEQKQKEAAIYKQYTSDGTLKSAIQPSRQQNRKHQLTSLAMKAAEVEIASLDSQIARTNTKTLTKNRYGW